MLVTNFFWEGSDDYMFYGLFFVCLFKIICKPKYFQIFAAERDLRKRVCLKPAVSHVLTYAKLGIEISDV